MEVLPTQGLAEILEKLGRETQNVAGNGFCLLNSIQVCLERDYDIFVSEEKMKSDIMTHAARNHSFYNRFHPGLLLSDLKDFLETREFNQDVVDLLVKILPEALCLNLFIFKNERDKMTLIKVERKDFAVDVYLHLVYCKDYMAANHFNPLVLKGNDTQRKLHLLFNTPVKRKGFLSRPDLQQQASESDDDCIIVSMSPANKRRRTEQQLKLNLTGVKEDPDEVLIGVQPFPQEEESDVILVNSENEDEICSSDLDMFKPKKEEPHNGAEGPGFQKRDDFPMWRFTGVPLQKATHLPLDIDGTCHFQIPCKDAHAYPGLTADSRWFVMTTSSRKELKLINGVRKIGWCEGSLYCPAPNCSYLLTNPYNKPNKHGWLTDKKIGVKRCKVCNTFAQRKPCSARKLVEFNPREGIVEVYHLGNHSCTLKPSGKQQAKQQMESILKDVTAHKKPRDLQRTRIKKALLDDFNVEEAFQQADLWRDTRMIQNVMQANKLEANPDRNSWDAVGVLKSKADPHDPYWIYKVNFGLLNNTRSYVMKSSKFCVNMMLDMDKDAGKGNPLEAETVYFDGVENRVDGMVSYALWVYHSTLKGMVRLCNMEMVGQTSADITTFFNLINRMLREEKKDPDYKFNPHIFMCDEAGANLNALKQVYGFHPDSKRVQTCKFHFQQSYQKRIHFLPADMREDFKNDCEELMYVQTVSGYNLVKENMLKYCKYHKDMPAFMAWWDARRYHLFSAFKTTSCNMNLAEPGNSAWRRQQQLTLVDSCYDDITTQVQQETDINALYKEGDFSVQGKGQSQPNRMVRDKKQQVSRAIALGDTLGDTEAILQHAAERRSFEGFNPGNCKHRPPNTTGKYNLQGKLLQPAKKNKDLYRLEKNNPPEREISESASEADLYMPRISASQPTRSKPKTTPLKVKANQPPGAALLRSKIEFCKTLLPSPVEDYQEPLSTRAQKLPTNNPRVCRAIGKQGGVSRCQGCHKRITPEEKVKTMMLVFTKMGHVRMLNQKTHEYFLNWQNCYFHLKTDCIQKFDGALEMRDITCTDKELTDLSDDQLVILANEGILPFILANKF